MLRISLAGLRAHLSRTLLAAASVALGVAFLAGTLIYADTAKAGFYDDFARPARGVDVAANPPDENGYTNHPQLTAADLAAVRQLPGVAAADGRVVARIAVLDHTGRALNNGGQVGYAVSVPDPGLTPTTLISGRMPAVRGETVLDKPTAHRLGLAVGAVVTVLDKAGHPYPLRLVGIVDFGAGPIFNGFSVVTLTTPDLTTLTGVTRYATIVARAGPGVSQASLVGAVRSAVHDRARVVTGDELREDLARDSAKYVDGFLTVLLAGSLVALVVACLVVYNTFSILAAQRTRELALLRCAGASRAQLLQVMLAECLAVGAGAAAVGTGLSLLVAPLIMVGRNIFGAEEPSQAIIVGPTALLGGFLVGLTATLAAGLVPAVRASGIAPLAVLRAVSDDTGRRTVGAVTVRLVAAALLALLGIAVMSRGTGRGFDGVTNVIGGAMFVFVGLVVALPAVIAPITRVVGWLPGRLFGVSGRLGVGNARRHPARAAAAAIALMIGVALVSLFTVVLATAYDQSARELAENFPIDFQLDPDVTTAPGSFQDQPHRLPDSLVTALRQRSEFDVVVRTRGATAFDRDGAAIMVSTIDPASPGGTGDDPAAKLPVEVMQGSLTELGDGTIAVRKTFVATHNVGVGDTVRLSTGDGQPLRERIVAIYDDAPIGGEILMQWNAFNSAFGAHNDAILIRKNPDVDATRAEVALDQVLTAYPLVSSTSSADRREDLTKGISQRLAQFDALLGLSLVIAILGIMDTLALSVLERTRESAILRALGLSRRQLRATIVIEAMLTSLIGGLVGVAFGVVVGRQLALSLINVYGHGGATVPVLPLAGYLVLAAAAGALASLVPARRAGRTAVVTAMA